MKEKEMTRLILLFGAALALISCTVDPQSRYYPTESQVYFRDVFGPRYQVTVPPVYCYSTLADPECYAAPVAGWEHRLIAQVGPRAF
jgi:hypothetical protein